MEYSFLCVTCQGMQNHWKKYRTIKTKRDCLFQYWLIYVSRLIDTQTTVVIYTELNQELWRSQYYFSIFVEIQLATSFWPSLKKLRYVRLSGHIYA